MIKEKDLAVVASSGAGENHIAVLERISPDLISCSGTAQTFDQEQTLNELKSIEN